MKRVVFIIGSFICATILLISVTINFTLLSIFRQKQESIDVLTKEEFFAVYAEASEDLSIEIPIVEINTENEEFPQNKEEYINCSFSMTNTPNAEYDVTKPMAESPKSEGGVGIRLRGNSTLESPKKPFRVKFNEKTSLMGLEKNKSWVLLADAYDNSKILNYAGFSLGKIMENLEWTPTPNHVILFMNNYFQGIYLLTEQVDENYGRVDVKTSLESGKVSFLAEISRPGYVEEFYDLSVIIDSKNGVFAEIKYPDLEDYEIEEGRAIEEYIGDNLDCMWDAIRYGEATTLNGDVATLEDIIDIYSLIDYYIVNEVLSNLDAGRRSTYVYKRNDEKIKIGPLWDFDLQDKEFIGLKAELFKALLTNEKYYNLVAERYLQCSNKVDDTIDALWKQYNKICVVAKIDSMLWNDVEETFYEQAFSAQIAGIETKAKQLKELFGKSHAEFLQSFNGNTL